MRECFLIPSTFGYGERCMTTGAERRYTSTSVSFQLDYEMNDDVMTILVLNLCLSLSLPFFYICINLYLSQTTLGERKSTLVSGPPV